MGTLTAMMPTRPLLLRTSELSRNEKFQNRIGAFARQVTAVELSTVIETSVSTARRRRTGRGWKFAELLVFADVYSIDPSSFFDWASEPPRIVRLSERELEPECA